MGSPKCVCVCLSPFVPQSPQSSGLAPCRTLRLSCGLLSAATISAQFSGPTGAAQTGPALAGPGASDWWNVFTTSGGTDIALRDNRHTLVTELAESGAGDEVIMSIASHVSRAMLSRYSHVRIEAKRRALDEIAARQCAADEKRKGDAERQMQATATPLTAAVQ